MYWKISNNIFRSELGISEEVSVSSRARAALGRPICIIIIYIVYYLAYLFKIIYLKNINLSKSLNIQETW